MKKLLILLCVCLVLSGCSAKTTDEPVPTLSPKITHPEGVWYDTKPPMVEGVVTKITKDKIVLSVENEDVKLTLSKRAKEEIDIFKEKHNMEVKVGSFLQVKYIETEKGLGALNIAFVEAN